MNGNCEKKCSHLSFYAVLRIHLHSNRNSKEKALGYTANKLGLSTSTKGGKKKKFQHTGK